MLYGSSCDSSSLPKALSSLSAILDSFFPVFVLFLAGFSSWFFLRFGWILTIVRIFRGSLSLWRSFSTSRLLLLFHVLVCSSPDFPLYGFLKDANINAVPNLPDLFHRNWDFKSYYDCHLLVLWVIADIEHLGDYPFLS